VTSVRIKTSDDGSTPVCSGTVCRFSFVIVSYNTLPLTRAAVISVARHTAEFPHEVILVDNNSRDGSPVALAREFPRLKVIVLDRNEGFAAANNAGARAAEGEWLVLMNSDAELLPDTMPRLDALLRRHGQLDVLGGQLLNPDGSLQKSVILDRRDSRFEQKHQQADLVEVAGVIGAFMVVRRALWRALGGMDEGFFFYFEETDFCRRARRAGGVVRWSPHFRVLHHCGSSVGELNLRAQVEFWLSLHYYWRKDLSVLVYKLRVCWAVFGIIFNLVGNFLLGVFTGFQARRFVKRLRSYRHLLKWHLQGCPADWGLRPFKPHDSSSTRPGQRRKTSW
jgi:GT2 family glycosyltransferase